MTTSTSYTFTTSTNYTFGSEVEITGGEGSLLDIRPTGATCAALFDVDTDLTWGDGTTTATDAGSPTITSGQLNLTGASGNYVTYDATSNADAQQTLTVRFTLVPNYTGNPAATQTYFTISQAAASVNNEVKLYQLTNGNMTILVRDAAGATIIVSNFGAWSPTSGTSYEFELNLDITSGATRLFIDGVQQGSTIASTGTRGSSIGMLRIGADANGANSAGDFKMDNFVVFDSIQHTAAHAGEIPYADPIKYSESNPKITANTAFNSTELQSFSTTETATSPDAVRYTLSVNGQERYWNGAAWADSNGTYAQASSAADINTNISSAISARSSVKPIAYLHSEYGGTTPSVDIITITYDLALADPTLSTAVNLEGYVYDTNGPIASEDIKFRPYLSGWINEGVFQKYEFETVATTDSSGYFSCTILLQPAGRFWEMRVGAQSYKLTLLDQAEMDLKDASTFEAITE